MFINFDDSQYFDKVFLVTAISGHEVLVAADCEWDALDEAAYHWDCEGLDGIVWASTAADHGTDMGCAESLLLGRGLAMDASTMVEEVDPRYFRAYSEAGN